MSTRDGFEAWYAQYHEAACAEFGGIDCTNPKGIAEDAWQAARAAALEEAGSLCDAIANGFVSDINPERHPERSHGADACGIAIRALAKAEGEQP